MKFFPRLKSVPAAVFGSICMIALTSLGGATANSALEFERNLELADHFLSDSELEFLNSLDAFSEEELAEKLERKGETFTYTAAGGLEATNPFCERFIDPSGAYGVNGKVIAEYLAEKLRHNRSTPMLSDDLVGMETAPNICPNWREFSDEEKIKFWTWTFAAMSAVESSCGASVRGMRGVRGMPVYSKTLDARGRKVIVRYKVAIGLLQLEKEKRDRAWRGYKTCSVADSEIGKTYHNLRCGMDIMEGLVSADGDKSAWPIYPGPKMAPTSYWQHLREKNGGKIGRLMRSFRPCHGVRALPTNPIPAINPPIPFPALKNPWPEHLIRPFPGEVKDPSMLKRPFPFWR